MSFLIVPGPPSPWMVSALLMKFGNAFGKTLAASRTMALNNFAAETGETCSLSEVKTPIIC